MLHLLPRNVFTYAQPWHVLTFIHLARRVLSIHATCITLTLARVRTLLRKDQPVIQAIKEDKKEIQVTYPFLHFNYTTVFKK